MALTIGTDIISTVQWPYMDMRNLGINKMLVGLDLIGIGEVTLQVAYNQQDPTTLSDNAGFSVSTGVTAPYVLNMEDIVPGQPVPLPINAPSFSLILTFDGGTIATPNAWVWDAANFYINDQSGGGATG
jgi:hypothetical protein